MIDLPDTLAGDLLLAGSVALVAGVALWTLIDLVESFMEGDK